MALGLIVGGTVLGLIVVLTLWHRLPRWVALAAVSLIGAVIGAGALLLQQDPGPADWVATLGILLAFAPVHCRFVFGDPGRPA